MSVIVSSAWKSKKVGDVVTFKGVDYTVGYDAFASLEAAAEADQLTDLVIVDKKLASPVKGKDVVSAGTDIFTSEVADAISKDGKTVSTVTKFSASASGSASTKDADVQLTGFETVTAKSAGGTFKGGKHSYSAADKVTNDTDRGLYARESSAIANSVASGSLSVAGDDPTSKVSVATGSIPDEAGRAIDSGVSFANVTLKNAELDFVDGGSYVSKSALKESDLNGEIITHESASSTTWKAGTGTASLTDSDVTGVIGGFKNVNITASKAPVTISEISNGSESKEKTSKTAFENGKSSGIITSEKKNETVSGNVTLTGNATNGVTVSDEIEGAASISAKYATINGVVEAENDAKVESTSVTVKQQKGGPALSATYSKEKSEVAAGAFTAENSVYDNTFVAAEGLKTVSFKDSAINGTFDAVNVKAKTGKKESGYAVAGISADQELDYVDNFGVDAVTLTQLDTGLVDENSAYAYEYAYNEETAIGGTKFQISGKTSDASNVTIKGYSSVTLDNTDKGVDLTATLDNRGASEVVNDSGKYSFIPDASYSAATKNTTVSKVVGDATITGNVTASIDGFASVKVSGEDVKLTEIYARLNENTSAAESATVKATKVAPIGNFAHDDATTRQGVTSLEVSKSALTGLDAKDLKSVKLQNVTGDAKFSGAVDETQRYTKKVAWIASDVSKTAADDGSIIDIDDTAVTGWSEGRSDLRSVSGTFSLSNASEVFALNSAESFKSVTISGAIDKMTVGNVDGYATYKYVFSKELSVNGAKGVYANSSSTSHQAVTSLDITKATLTGAYSDLKTAKVKDVAGTANFEARRNSDRTTSERGEWNAKDYTFADVYADNSLYTAYASSSESRDSVVGTLTLSNSDAAALITDLSAVNFKSADLTFTGSVSGSLENLGNSTSKSALKRTVSDTRIVEEQSTASSADAVASLKVTGKKNDLAEIAVDSSDVMRYSSVDLKDAILTGGGEIDARNEAFAQTVSKNAIIDGGNVDAITYKLNQSGAQLGRGSFTATITGDAKTVYDGDLYGFNTITLKDKVSIGNVNNYREDGLSSESALVPFDINSYDESDTSLWTTFTGNVSGSYTLGMNGDVVSKWVASQSTIASGSFTQTASVVDITAGDISGYDKVSLEGVKTAGTLEGYNTKQQEIADYRYNGVVLNDTIVETKEKIVSNSVTVKGKTFDKVLQVAQVGGMINGYKNVTLENAEVLDVYGRNSKKITTTDLTTGDDVTREQVLTVTGTFTATDSTISAEVEGYQTVKLTDTFASGVAFGAGNYRGIASLVDGNYVTSYGEKTATGSLTATGEQDTGPYDVDSIVGFQKVSLTNYSVTGAATVYFLTPDDPGLVGTIDATYVVRTEADLKKGTPVVWKKEAKTRNNSFTASATVKNKVTEVVDIAAVTGYGKVEATNLKSIGSIENAKITDLSGVVHYGDWTATAVDVEDNYTAMKVVAGNSVKITGQKDAATAVTGNIAGYAAITLDNVELSDALYAGGNYDLASKATKTGNIVSTATTTANGALKITNATASGVVLSMEGFKTIAADIASDVEFDQITGGKTVDQYTDGTLDYSTRALSGSVDLKTDEGVVSGLVSGFSSMTFTDTNFTGAIYGDDITMVKKGGIVVPKYTAKASVVFVDDDKAAQDISGMISNAKEITFKATADADVDFLVTALIDSQLGSNTRISIEKCEMEADLTNFYLDGGDDISVASGAVVKIDLGGSKVEDYFANMVGAGINGSGTLAFTGSAYGDADEFKAALMDQTTSGIAVSSALKVTYNA